VQGLKRFVVRAEARGGEIRGVTILYDQATEGTMSSVALATASAFIGFPDPNSASPPGVRRMVEYGTAIVVSADGDLIASAHVTDECQAITVPSVGHAERVAEDKASDLALIRLYGTHNLVPAPLPTDVSRPAGEIVLVGVADPLVQAGGDDVTRVAARLTAQDIEPAPKPGFSGAAAVDAAGALIGMVELRPAVIAGNSVASQSATLLPVEAIRAFLQEQNVTASLARNEHAPIEPSVVRVICVRK